MCQRMGARVVWALSNFTVFACMAGTAVISLMSRRENSKGIEHIITDGNETTRTAAVIVFALLGFPLAVCVSLNQTSSFLFLLHNFSEICDKTKTILFFLLCRSHTVFLSLSQQKSLLIPVAVKVCEKIQSFTYLLHSLLYAPKWFHHSFFLFSI